LVLLILIESYKKCCLGFFLILPVPIFSARETLAELADALPKFPADFGQPAHTKDEQYDHQNNHPFPSTDSRHICYSSI
jgi:hypothetical protein